ncbi:4-hydroxyphenylacetate 3-hydroxylase [Nakamurella sp. YIM 132087]|uniref:4-hydroxyphenylacetate 3-hydroxylase n=1 Tax=Nakamurella alba TaxID=2665158 RepID=A0A7K1FLK3_9ACTN|nr:4-hydroxyphenylacetate 3-hydroxylase N-terminal domain-containing protein [Nakamurella alba]MTD14103.1 4-hydroxyphenylacetate 3-hydroxylase [Nakamurella alba]
MMTGEEYRQSIRDGRATYYKGKRIDDITLEPEMSSVVDLVAAGYDRWYDPDAARHPLMSPPRSVEEMRERIPVFETLDVMTDASYQSFSTLVTAAGRLRADNPDIADRILAYVDSAQAKDIRITECITDSKGDRSLKPSAQVDPDQYLHVVDRQADGVVVRGAKLHITGASFGHDLMAIPTKRMRPGEDEYSIACMVPVNSPGVKIVNVGFPPKTDDPRDQPATWAHNMFDGFVIFDDVFVPNERILLDGKPELAAIFAHSLGLWERLGGVTYMADQADEVVGLALLIAEANGLAKISHVREKIDELAIHATMLRAGLEAAVTNAHSTPEGYFYPDELYTNAAKYQGATMYGTMIRHLLDIAGGSVFTVPAMADFDNPDVGDNLRKYMATGNASPDGLYRARLFATIRNLTSDDFGGWRLVAMLQSGGGLFAQRIVARGKYDFEAARHRGLKAAGLLEGDH